MLLVHLPDFLVLDGEDHEAVGVLLEDGLQLLLGFLFGGLSFDFLGEDFGEGVGFEAGLRTHEFEL